MFWKAVLRFSPLLIVLTVVGASFFFIARAQWRQTGEFTCRNRIKQISLALHSYHDRYGSFPPAYVLGESGERFHSWRVLLLPFLGHEDLYNRYRWDEPWNGPHNRVLAERCPDVYRCPLADNQQPYATNYVAVVAPTTAWPDQYGATLADVVDEPSQTIHVIETGRSNIGWMEPRDLTIPQALGNPPGGGPTASSSHEWISVAFVDGSAKALSPAIDRKLLGFLLTIHGGQPLASVEWPLDALPLGPVEGFSPPVQASALAATDVLPYADVELVPGRNVLYCCSFQLAWEELQKLLGEPVDLEGDPLLARKLNEQSFPRDGLSEDAFLAVAGLVREGIRERIAEEMGRRFPSASPTLNHQASDKAVVAYAYLQKILPFPVKFASLREPLVFRSSSGPVPVASFGVREFADLTPWDGAIRRQVRVLDYVSDDDFVIALETRSSEDELVLAKITPEATLDATIRAVRGRSEQPSPNHNRPQLVTGDRLIIPKLIVNVRRDYQEIAGRDILSGRLPGYFISVAAQVIRFRLDEKGAYLESEAEIIGENGHTLREPDRPRNLMFDRPFLLYLRERNAGEPYFALWIENDELMSALPQ